MKFKIFLLNAEIEMNCFFVYFLQNSELFLNSNSNDSIGCLYFTAVNQKIKEILMWIWKSQREAVKKKLKFFFSYHIQFIAWFSLRGRNRFLFFQTNWKKSTYIKDISKELHKVWSLIQPLSVCTVFSNNISLTFWKYWSPFWLSDLALWLSEE